MGNECKTQSNDHRPGPAGFRVSSAEEQSIRRRRRGEQSTSSLPRVELKTYNSVLQAIITSRVKFPKDIDHYAPLAFFGPNVVVSEGEEWKKFRKIVAPAFSEVCPAGLRSSPNPGYDCQRNNKLVWDETILVMTGLFDDVWGDKSEIVVDQCVDITLPVRFLWRMLYT